MNAVRRLLTDLVPFNPARLANNAARYSLEGAPGDSTFLVDNSNRIQLIADRSGNSAVNAFVCNGVAGGNFSVLTTGFALGTGDATWVVDLKTISGTDEVLCTGGSSSANQTANSFNIDVSVGSLRVFIYNAAANGYRIASVANFLTTYTGQRVVVTVTRASTTLNIYINGVSVSFSETPGGTSPPADFSQTLTTTYLSSWANGAGYPVAIYAHRLYSAALDAAGVAADYAGTVQANNVVNVQYATAAKLAPNFVCTSGQTVTINTSGDLGARISGERDLYQGTAAKQPVYFPIAGAGAQLLTGNNSTFGGATTVWSFDVGATVGSGKLNLNCSAGTGAYTTSDSFLTPGMKYRCEFTISNYVSGTVRVLFGGPSSSVVTGSASANGTVVFEGIATSGQFGIGYTAAGTLQCSIDDATVYALENNVPYAYFDGSNDYLKSAPFALVQPESVYLTGSQVTWTNGYHIISGYASGGLSVYQRTSTPQIGAVAASIIGNIAPTLGQRFILTNIISGASSLLKQNIGIPVSGNMGAGDMSGITVGAGYDGSVSGNITLSELLLRSVADPTSLQLRIAQYYMRKYGIPQ